MANNSSKTVFNRGNPDNIANEAQRAKLGTVLAVSPAILRGAVASNVLELPEGLKARQVLNCYSAAGTTTGELTPVARETTPSTGEVAVDPGW